MYNRPFDKIDIANLLLIACRVSNLKLTEQLCSTYILIPYNRVQEIYTNSLEVYGSLKIEVLFVYTRLRLVGIK